MELKEIHKTRAD